MHAKKLNEYSAAGNVSAGIEFESFLSVSDAQYSAPGDVSAGIDNTSAEDITPEKRSTEERKYSSSAISG